MPERPRGQEGQLRTVGERSPEATRKKEEVRTRAVSLKVWAAAFLAAVAAAVVALAVGTEPAKAAFPGSNGAIAYVNAGQQVFRMSSDGFGQTQISDSLGSNAAPNWSADNKKIVFVNGHSGGPDIYWMNADGSWEQALTPDPGNIDSEPAFFPDHHKIVFTREILGDTDIYRMTVNDAGTIIAGPTPLTATAANETSPVVSPDGKKIAFVSDRDGDNDIYVMNANAPESPTNKAVKLTKSAANDSSPEWSPGGTRIAFESHRSGNAEVWVMKPRPEGKRNRPKNLTRNPAQDTQPAFSPDGRKMAFVSNRSGNADIFKMEVDGLAQVNLTNSGGIRIPPPGNLIPKAERSPVLLRGCLLPGGAGATNIAGPSYFCVLLERSLGS